METGRFQPAIENKCESSAFEERFGRAPFGAEGLSVSFVRAAYGATGVNQNPGDSPAFGSFPGASQRKKPGFPQALKN
ncbi:hypothetical protein [Desulfitobacterium hafniense]|uniref:hypothetical protein n=1 Tax=Desulfitobacterium hafniense TaxID=49338 RepID=UPI000A77E5C9|nr:hypothetical protein [Desulfitobacterium hafniense]